MRPRAGGRRAGAVDRGATYGAKIHGPRVRRVRIGTLAPALTVRDRGRARGLLVRLLRRTARRSAASARSRETGREARRARRHRSTPGVGVPIALAAFRQRV